MVGKKMGRAAVAMVVFLLVGCTRQPQRLPQGEWVDLTHVLSSESVFWPTSEKFQLSTVFAGRTEHGYYYSAENLTNLDRLPPTGALVIALPIKIGGGSGGPLRAIALIPQ